MYDAIVVLDDTLHSVLVGILSSVCFEIKFVKFKLSVKEEDIQESMCANGLNYKNIKLNIFRR